MSEEISQDEPYRVLARKYRPRNFDELIGQDALVRTLSNAIESGRIAHAFMLTGVRGVGKTTTARIIAKALNYKGPDGNAGPTVGPTDDCDLCQAITEDRHPDVIEMDAASRTGVDDIREILDGVRYAPSEARYKVYVIDEVHMLSKNAFNALLKTLEEPPEHVKFIFATTEIRKVPVTVLSRCQRFDLRRVDVPTLTAHFTSICEKENVKADEAALAAIARAADGSVRDGLSLLDQAIALASSKEGGEAITAEQVEGMLGLSDRAQNLDILEHALSGNIAEALEIMDELYANGADPVVLVQDLLELTHILTKFRAVPGTKAMKHAMAADQVSRAGEMAGQISMPSLAKAWQILLKGLAEVQAAPNPQNAAEMVLIRLSYAADLPDPVELLKTLKDGGGDTPQSPQATPAAPIGNIPNHLRSDAASDGQAGRSFSEPASASGGGGAPPDVPVGAPVPAEMPRGGRGDGARAALAVVPQSEVAPVMAIRTLEDVVQILEQNKEMILASQVYQYAHLVKLESLEIGGRLEIRPEEEASPRLAQDLGQALGRITGERWIVTISAAPGQASLAAVAKSAQEKELQAILELPEIRDILSAFPEAEIVGVKQVEEE